MSSQFSFSDQHQRKIAYWLIFVAVMIFGMVMLGGVTRLTGSGLSMVDWKPIMGIVPPMNETEWQEAFDKYKQFPEYQKINQDMDLEGFKGIFYFEYGHRVLGRLIGVAFFVPFMIFYLRKQIPRQLTPKLVIIFILGGLQGLLGWIMVKSGLVDNPNVSQYRLAAHLMAAILIYSYILWTAWSLLHPTPRNGWVRQIEKLRSKVNWLTIIVILMIFTGALVAGTHAGGVHKTFPLMNGGLIPDGLFGMSPFLINFFENPTTIQFNHRLIAYVIIALVLIIWFKSRHFTLTSSTRNAIQFLLIMMIIQVGLGISTLLSVPDEPVRAGVSVTLASLHQGFALLLLTVVLYTKHELRRGN